MIIPKIQQTHGAKNVLLQLPYLRGLGFFKDIYIGHS
jgi:hypothetical protein